MEREDLSVGSEKCYEVALMQEHTCSNVCISKYLLNANRPIFVVPLGPAGRQERNDVPQTPVGEKAETILDLHKLILKTRRDGLRTQKYPILLLS